MPWDKAMRRGVPPMARKKSLTLATLRANSSVFVRRMSKSGIPGLFGVTDGKAVGTFVERAFHEYLERRFAYERGSSASGIDFPALGVDLKVTSARQPQSSCPFKSASQKVYGLGYHLLVFVYEKRDDRRARTARLRFKHAIWVRKQQTGDYQTTRGLLDILSRDGNKDDVVAFLEERNLPLEEVGRERLASRILSSPLKPGYLTVSNALQWRLQYSRVVALAEAGNTRGVENLLAKK